MTDSYSTTSSSTRRARSRRAAPRGARLALCLAFVVALGAARPAEAFKWRWWKWKAIAAHHSKSPDDTSMKHVGHMKHMGGMTSGDDSECDDCGTWWRAKQWREGSWWGKHCRRDDGWKPGTGLRAGKCMVHQCGWQLKKCRWDMTCRESVQCAIGAWGEARKGHRHVRVSRLSRKAHGTRVPRVLLFRESAFSEHESVDANTRSSVARFLLGHVFRFSCAHRFSRFFFSPQGAAWAATPSLARARSSAHWTTATTSPRPSSHASWTRTACPRCRRADSAVERREEKKTFFLTACLTMTTETDERRDRRKTRKRARLDASRRTNGSVHTVYYMRRSDKHNCFPLFKDSITTRSRLGVF
jgi:hypothetical protein